VLYGNHMVYLRVIITGNCMLLFLQSIAASAHCHGRCLSTGRVLAGKQVFYFAFAFTVNKIVFGKA